MKRYEDRVVVVTGGANGIGKACCERFGSEGASIVVADRDAAAGTAFVDELSATGVPAMFVELDATSRIDNEVMASSAVERFGRIDALVTAAGILYKNYDGATETEVKRMAERERYAGSPHLEVFDYDIEEFRSVLEVNLIGTFLAVQACGSQMADSGGGSIVTIASIASKNPNAGPIAYTASKSGVWMLTKKLGTMLASANIRINAIGPGFIETNMTQVFDLMPAAQHDAFMNNVPLGRRGQPSDIAATAAFLCSDDAGYFTGEILHPSGGYFTG